MKHIKYPSIENAKQTIIDDFKNSAEFKNYSGKWVITEKIHGMNFQIGYDNNKIIYGSRNQLISDISLERKNALQNIIEVIPKIWSHLNCKESLTLFGEYFGGNWPNYNHHNEKIQRGIYYTPMNVFAMFDIVVDNKYLPYQEVIDISNKFNIYMPPNLGIYDTLDECLLYPNNNPSRVNTELLNIPRYYFKIEDNQKINQSDNIMEGIIIRPFSEDLWKGEHRIIIKSKNDKFKETSKEQKIIETKELTENVKKYIDIINQYITENRLLNVLSHYSEKPDINNFNIVMKDYIQDVMDDINKDYPNFEYELDKDEDKKPVIKYIRQISGNIIRKELLK